MVNSIGLVEKKTFLTNKWNQAFLLVLNENLLSGANSQIFRVLSKRFVFVVWKMAAKMMAPEFSEPRVSTIHSEKEMGNVLGF